MWKSRKIGVLALALPVVLLAGLTIPIGPLNAQPSSEPVKAGAQPVLWAKVGEVIIVGNAYRSDFEVLRLLTFFPGQVLSFPDLKDSEEALVRSGLFKVDLETGIRPRVQVLDSPGEFKDILVKVEDLPPTLFECLACPAALVGIVFMMGLLALAAVWRHYHHFTREE